MGYQAPEALQIGKAEEWVQGGIGSELDQDLATWRDNSLWHQNSDFECGIPKHSSPHMQSDIREAENLKERRKPP